MPGPERSVKSKTDRKASADAALAKPPKAKKTTADVVSENDVKEKPSKKAKKDKTSNDANETASSEPTKKHKKDKSEPVPDEPAASQLVNAVPDNTGVKKKSKSKSKAAEPVQDAPKPTTENKKARAKAADFLDDTQDSTPTNVNLVPSKKARKSDALIPETGTESRKTSRKSDADPPAIESPVAKTWEKPKPKASLGRSEVPIHKDVSGVGAKAKKRKLIEDEIPVVEEVGVSSANNDDHLHGFSTDEDSSDDDVDLAQEPALDVARLPTVAKDDAVVKKRLAAAKAKHTPAEERGVLYLGRIPHGFYEDEMRKYYSQFGEVTRLRLSRNKKTGRSKHYAFIEFESLAVAKIVQETMDNYLLLGHILQCKLIPNEKVHPELWVGANRKWRTVPHDRIARVKHNRKRTGEDTSRAEARLLARQEAKKRKLADAGIDYDFDAVAYKKVATSA